MLWRMNFHTKTRCGTTNNPMEGMGISQIKGWLVADDLERFLDNIMDTYPQERPGAMKGLKHHLENRAGSSTPRSCEFRSRGFGA